MTVIICIYMCHEARSKICPSDKYFGCRGRLDYIEPRVRHNVRTVQVLFGLGCHRQFPQTAIRI